MYFSTLLSFEVAMIFLFLIKGMSVRFAMVRFSF